MSKLFIFDLDGTLSDAEHRRHLVDGSGPVNWDKFYERSVADPPNTPVVEVFNTIFWKHDFLIFSGRSDVVRPTTIQWLRSNTVLSNMRTNEVSEKLLMRPEGDYTPDQDLKRQWYYGLSESDKKRLVGVFDDRQKVVGMWRSLGVACFQVAPGNF